MPGAIQITAFRAYGSQDVRLVGLTKKSIKKTIRLFYDGFTKLTIAYWWLIIVYQCM